MIPVCSQEPALFDKCHKSVSSCHGSLMSLITLCFQVDSRADHITLPGG